MCGSRLHCARRGAKRWFVADLDAAHVTREASGLWGWQRDVSIQPTPGRPSGRRSSPSADCCTWPSAAWNRRRTSGPGQPPAPSARPARRPRCRRGAVAGRRDVAAEAHHRPATVRWRQPAPAAPAAFDGVDDGRDRPANRAGRGGTAKTRCAAGEPGPRWLRADARQLVGVLVRPRVDGRTDLGGDLRRGVGPSRDPTSRRRLRSSVVENGLDLVAQAAGERLPDGRADRRTGGLETCAIRLGPDHPQATSAAIVYASTLQQRGAWDPAATLLTRTWRSHLKQIDLAEQPRDISRLSSAMRRARFDAGLRWRRACRSRRGDPGDAGRRAGDSFGHVGGRPARSYALPLSPGFLVAHLRGTQPSNEGFSPRPTARGEQTPLHTLSSLQRGFAERYGWLLMVAAGDGPCSIELDTGVAPRRLRLDVVSDARQWSISAGGTTRSVPASGDHVLLSGDYDAATRTIYWWTSSGLSWTTSFDQLPQSGLGPYGLRLLPSRGSDGCRSVTWTLRRARSRPCRLPPASLFVRSFPRSRSRSIPALEFLKPPPSRGSTRPLPAPRATRRRHSYPARVRFLPPAH